MATLFGKRLRSAREFEDMSQSQVAKIVGVSQPTIGNWENGRSKPSRMQINKLEKLLGPMQSKTSSKESEHAQSSVGAFGNWLKTERNAKGWSRQVLAEKASVSAMAIYNIEQQKIRNPQKSTRSKLSNALDVDVPGDVVEEAKEDQEIVGIGALEGFDPYDTSALPLCAGVYVFYDVSERPIYVGKGDNIAKRVKDHAEKFWFKRPIVDFGEYIEVKSDVLRHQVEQILIKFLKKNAVINVQSVER